jgi:thymidylate kinase
MEIEDYRSVNFSKSIVIEGGDHLGKGTVCENIAKHLSENGVECMPLSFPNYGLPLGASVRKFLSTGYFERETDLANEEIVYIKRAIFALNRLEVANLLLSSSEFKGKVLVWDRSSYSNAVSIGYYLYSEGMNVDEATKEGVETAFQMEYFLRESFNTDNCVLRLIRSESKWEAQREEREDIHENSEVQDLSDSVYDLYRDLVGEGWEDVVTRVGGSWRSHEEILTDAMEHVHNRVELKYGGKPVEITRISNRDIIRTLYGLEGRIPYIRELDEALRANLKGEIYEYGMLVSEYVIKNVQQVQWANEEIREAVRVLFRVTPMLEESLNDLWDGEFGTKIVQSLNV